VPRTKVPTNAEPLNVDAITTVTKDLVTGEISTLVHVAVTVVNTAGVESAGVTYGPQAVTTLPTGVPPDFVTQNTRTLPVVAGANNSLDVDPTGNYHILTGATGLFQLNGMDAGRDGRIILMKNATAFTATINHESASAVASERIRTPSGGAMDWPSGAVGLLVYQGDIQRWDLGFMSTVAAVQGVEAWNNRAGRVMPAANDYTFAQIASKPTTLAGYGITDAAPLSHTHAFTFITGKPTTLGGYGITDAAGLNHTHEFDDLLFKPDTLLGYGITDAAPLNHTHTWGSITDKPNSRIGFGLTFLTVDWDTEVTGKPTTLAGYGITDAALSGHTHNFAALNAIPTTLGGYGITDAAYSNHTHNFDDLQFKPTTLIGYGITDAAPLAHTHTFGSITDKPNTLSGYGITAISVAWDTEVSGKPTTLAGYGITDAAPLAHTHAFTFITGKPTTLAGYGITDAAGASHTHDFASLTSKPTTRAGYGITDAAAANHTHTFGSITDKPTTLSGYGITAISINFATEVSNKPTTLAGYGITDAAPLSHSHSFASLTGKPTTLGGYGITDDLAPANHTHTFESLTLKPTTLAGYGITDAASASHTHTFGSLTSKPTTLIGFGITDAAPSSHTHTFASLTSKPTTLAGYGITDALSVGNTGSFGSIQINGQTGGYAGIYFYTMSKYLMIHSTYQGIHNGSSWEWYFANGVLTAGSVPWARITGAPSSYPAAGGSADYATVAGSATNATNATYGVTQGLGTNNTTLATTAFVQAAVSAAGGPISATLTYSYAAVANGSSVAYSHSVTGAVVGQAVLVSVNSSSSYSRIFFQGQVTGTGTVLISMFNNTGASMSAGSIPITVRLI